jgi:hypothetical protein
MALEQKHQKKENTRQRIKKTSSGVWDPCGKKALDLKQITKIPTPKKSMEGKEEDPDPGDKILQSPAPWMTD